MADGIELWLRDVSGDEWFWLAKRLSANDTLANNAHQAGPYLPNDVARSLFPGIFEPLRPNPDVQLPASIDSHDGQVRTVRGVWYNNRLTGNGTRNEFRLTRWGGGTSPLLHPDSTGALVLMAFEKSQNGSAIRLRVWVCKSAAEEDFLVECIGPVEPKQMVFVRPGQLPAVVDARRKNPIEAIPEEWTVTFPAAEQIFDFAVQHTPLAPCTSVDERLLARRKVEYDVYRAVEERHVLPLARDGFASVDAFVNFSNSITNRRKSRAGKSLELHLKKIFEEEGLSFDHGATIEGNKRPDFLFPGAYHYRNREIPDEKLRMLGAKTTCKDRWRQILGEADRIKRKHLFTLQDGISETQHREMVERNVQLVVPKANLDGFPHAVRSELQTLDSFVRECRSICRSLGLTPQRPGGPGHTELDL